tara:strand:+ start:368 stop:1078 length:711 start_codon:yes stop_codon:yes gene_type:complete
MNPRAAGAAGLRRRFPRGAMRLMPGQPGVSEDDPRLQWHALQGPGGGYSGGVIPRFQSGRTVNPRAGGAARRREYKNWMAVNNPLAPTGPGGTGQLQGPVRYPPPGGWQLGGAVGYGHGEDVGPRNVIDVSTPAGRRKHRALGQYWGPIGVRRIGTAEAKEAWANRARRQASRSPGGGYSGGVVPSFQAGGQFEEPVYPVESELADESPWYPDEEVGYEEEAPMQGGFDIFGRGGG